MSSMIDHLPPTILFSYLIALYTPTKFLRAEAQVCSLSGTEHSLNGRLLNHTFVKSNQMIEGPYMTQLFRELKIPLFHYHASPSPSPSSSSIHSIQHPKHHGAQRVTFDISVRNNNTHLWCFLYIVFSSYPSSRIVAAAQMLKEGRMSCTLGVWGRRLGSSGEEKISCYLL